MKKSEQILYTSMEARELIDNGGGIILNECHIFENITTLACALYYMAAYTCSWQLQARQYPQCSAPCFVGFRSSLKVLVDNLIVCQSSCNGKYQRSLWTLYLMHETFLVKFTKLKN